MPSVSRKQQRFFGIVRAYQKGDLKTPPSPEVQGAATSMKKKDVKKFASTKHKGLPEKKVRKESFNEDYVKELEDGLVKMDYPAYDEVDELMKKIAKDNNIDTTTLHMAFKTKHLMVPDDWAKRKMMEPVIIPKTPVKEGAWDDVESIVFKHRANQGRNPNPNFKEIVKNSKKNPLKDLKDKLDKPANKKEENNEEYLPEISMKNPTKAKNIPLGQKSNPYGKRAVLKAMIRGISEKERSKAGAVNEASKYSSIVRAGIKLGGKKGGRLAQKGEKAALAYGKNKASEAAKGGKDAGAAEKTGAAAGGLVGGAIGAAIPDGPLMVAGEIAGGYVGSKIGGAIGKKVDDKKRGKGQQHPQNVGKNKIVKTKVLKNTSDKTMGMSKQRKQTYAMSEEGLRDWFGKSKSKDGKGGWVNVVTGGTCASDEPGEGTPKCVSSSKRASMTKAERASASRRKKKADPNQQSKSGAAKPTYVSTDKKKKSVKEGFLKEVSDAKMFRQSDENLDKLKKKFDGMDDGPANSFMRKRISKELKRREGQKRKEMLNPTVQIKDEYIAEKKVKRDEYGDIVGGPKISKKQLKKNLSSNEKDQFSNNESYDAKKKAMKDAVLSRKEDLKKKEKMTEMASYTGPNKKDRKQIKKLDKKDYAEKLAKYEKNMDPKKRQELKNKATKGMKFTYEETIKMTKKAYNKLHRDFKSDDPNNPRTTKYVKGKGTVSMPVKFIEAKENIDEAAAWTRKAGKNQSGGLNEKGRKSYERANPGSDLKAPSKKKGNKRRASFCARMKGMKSKLTSAKTARDPDSRINKSLRAWNCSYEPENGEVLSETMLATLKRKVGILGGKSNKKPAKKTTGRDAGAIARKVLQQKQHKKYVNFLDIDEEKKKCGEGEYYCNDDKKCKSIPKGYRVGYGGMLKPDNSDDDTNGKNGNGNGHGGNGNGGNGGGNGGGDGGGE